MAIPSYFRNSKSYMDRIQIFFNGLVGTSILLFAAGFFYFSNEVDPGEPLIKNGLFLTIVAGILLMVIPLFMFLFKRRIQVKLEEEIRDKKLTDRMRRFYYWRKRLWVGHFLAALIPVSFYLLSSWVIFTGIFGIALVIFTMQRPTAQGIVRQINMDDEEKRAFLEKEDLF